MNGIRIPNDWRWGRVREDVDAGRLWKARDRLQGCLLAEPANQDVLDMLGAVWFAMGDLPAAGRHWWLTERDDEKAATARAAFYERFGHRAHEVLRALPRPAKPEHYPVSVRGRLEELVTAAKADGHGWHPSDWKPTPSEWESGWRAVHPVPPGARHGGRRHRRFPRRAARRARDRRRLGDRHDRLGRRLAHPSSKAGPKAGFRVPGPTTLSRFGLAPWAHRTVLSGKRSRSRRLCDRGADLLAQRESSHEVAQTLVALVLAAPIVFLVPYVVPQERSLALTIVLAVVGFTVAAGSWLAAGWIVGAVRRRRSRDRV